MNVTLGDFTFNIIFIPILFALVALFVWRFTDLPRFWMERGQGNKKLMQASMHWPPTTGKIVSSAVTHGPHTERGEQRAAPKFYPEIKYEYVVNGTTFSSERRGIGGEIGLAENAAHAIVERYAVGAQVTVYYNPAQPSEALLERQVTGLQLRQLILPVAVLAFLIAAGLLFVLTTLSARNVP